MMRAGTGFIFAVLVALLMASAAQAADFQEKRFYVTPFVGWTFFDTERRFSSGQDLNDDVYFGGRAGMQLAGPMWLDLAGGYTGTRDCASCTESSTHYSANLMWTPALSHTFSPFISLGGGSSTFRHAIGEPENAGVFEAAGGLRVRLNDAFGIRLEARNILAHSESGWSKAHIDDVVVGAGLTFGFGGGVKKSDGDAEVSRAPVVHAPDIVVSEKKLEMELLDTGKIRISNINFDHDRSTIRPDAYAILETVGRVLTKWEGLEIEINGHTDSRGTAAYNDELSIRRAEAVRTYLLDHFPQFKPAQLTAKSYGESRPIEDNASAAGMQENRRVEFVVLNKEILRRKP